MGNWALFSFDFSSLWFVGCYNIWHCPRPIGVWEGHLDLPRGGAPWARGKRWENGPYLVLTFLLFDLLALRGVVWDVYFCLSFSNLSALTFLLWDFYERTCNILLFVFPLHSAFIGVWLERCLYLRACSRFYSSTYLERFLHSTTSAFQ
jgi:hypothetical protein